jgi:hypothetical protein
MSGLSDKAAKAEESGEKAQEAHDTVTENKAHSCGLLDTIMGVVAAPVAGGLVFKAIYYLLVVFVMIWFIVCLADVSRTFDKPITEVKNIFNQTLPYPDVYFCVSFCLDYLIFLAELIQLLSYFPGHSDPCIYNGRLNEVPNVQVHPARNEQTQDQVNQVPRVVFHTWRSRRHGQELCRVLHSGCCV